MNHLVIFVVITGSKGTDVDSIKPINDAMPNGPIDVIDPAQGTTANPPLEVVANYLRGVEEFSHAIFGYSRTQGKKKR
jgi:hypothetical protein